MFGVAPALLIDCARQIHESHYSGEEGILSLDDFSRTLGAPISECTPVLGAMLADGFFEQRGEQQFVPTRKLNQLALAKISKGIPRAEAATLIAKITNKAVWINEHPADFDHRVRCVVVFGSYLSSKTVLGDLDIGVALDALRDAARWELNAYTEMQRMDAAHTRTFRALRLRQPKKISLHTVDEVIRLATPYQVIFGTVPNN